MGATGCGILYRLPVHLPQGALAATDARVRPHTSTHPDRRAPPGRPVACGTDREGLMHILDNLDAASLRSDVPQFRAGDTVKVHVKVVEGSRSRVQVFQGIVIRRHGGGVGETFTVRKISFGVGVERTFPLHSPVIDKVEVASRGIVRRAKLYYLRDLRGKKARIRERRDAVPAKG